MALARDLVELEAGLRERPGVDLFSPLDRSGLLELPECASVLGRLARTDAESVLRVRLQALRIRRAEMAPRLLDAELVATLPADTPGLARPTQRVVQEMVQRATSEVILLGYELTDCALVLLLADATARGAKVFRICDRG